MIRLLIVNNISSALSLTTSNVSSKIDRKQLIAI